MMDKLLGAMRPRLVNALLLTIVIAFGYMLCVRSIILSDEGYLLLQSLDLLNGRVIYRDMDSFVTPGIWFLLAGAFKLFGPSVFVSRMVSLAGFVALIVTTHRLIAPRTSRATGLVACACMVSFAVWAFPAWTFAFYSPFAVLFALLGLERLLVWNERKHARALLWSGVFLGLSICFKQNYGVFALLGAVAGFGAMKLEAAREGTFQARATFREISTAAAGVVLAGLPILVYLVVNGAVGDAWQSLVVHPFEFAGAHDIPVAPISGLWAPDVFTTAVEKLTYLSFAQMHAAAIAPLQAFQGVQRLHVLLYWIPLPIFALGGLLSIRFRERRLDPAMFSGKSVV